MAPSEGLDERQTRLDILGMITTAWLPLFDEQLQKKWGSTKNIMNDATIAAKFRDAAKAHFCEELYKVLLLASSPVQRPRGGEQPDIFNCFSEVESRS